MSNTWSEVDRYFADLFVPADTALEAALADSAAAGLPAINVAPVQGKLLYLLARSHRVRTVLEIGTLGGYSTIWLARALPDDGRVVTLEIDPKHAAVAQQNFDRAGVSGKIDLRVGSAHETLPQLHAAGAGPFDLVFIDADKVSTPAYLEWALKMTQPGSLIIVDNVVRNGAVTDAASTDDGVRGVRAALDAMAQHPHLITAAIQTVGQKGYDGLAFALVV
ncbi:O-methyltransferase [Anaerolineae bacterium CFX9]|nr:O-methyltransferase [Anaerolineae bacterium CFX9]